MAPDRTTGPRRGLKPPPNYLSRSVQWQLLMLLSLLLLVLMLMQIAARPENWAWMWRQREAQAAAEPESRASDLDLPSAPHRPQSPPVADSFVSPARVDPAAESGQGDTSRSALPPEIDEALLNSITDNTFFRAAEREAWFRLLSWLQASSQKQLETAVHGSVSSLQLLQQMPAYRGRLVRVHGLVRRAHPVNVPNNDAGIRTYWQCWLQDSAGTAPIVVYTLQVPVGFPHGQELREPAEFIGVAYKLWAYQAESGLLVAPVVLAKTPRWAPQPTPPARSPVTPGQVLLGAIAAALLSGLAVRFVYRRSRGRRSGSRGVDRPVRLGLLLMLGGLWLLPLQHAWGQPAADGLQDALRLYELDASRWRRFIDGQPLGGEELETLCRVLHVLPRLEASDVLRWQRAPTAWNDLAERSDNARGHLFEVHGEVTAWQAIELPAESARRFNYAKFYRVTLRSPADLHPRILYAREVPKQWQDRPPPTGEVGSVSCPGLFLKTGEGDSGKQALLFAAARVAWHPRRSDPSAGVNEGMALLGSAGMDVSLLNDVVQGTPLGHEDRECFYQMLYAAGRLDPTELPAAAAKSTDIQRLLGQPEACAGELMTLSGNARRAIRIEVTDSDVQERYGIDHYYEMELFLPLPQPLRLVDPHDGESRSYRTFPITICVRQLPSGIPQGPEIQHNVQVTGFYMKLRSYRSRFMQGLPGGQATNSARRRQISPLLIGVLAKSAERAPPTRRGFGLILAGVFLAVLVVIGLVARWYRHSDRAFEQWKHRASHPTPDLGQIQDPESELREAPNDRSEV